MVIFITTATEQFDGVIEKVNQRKGHGNSRLSRDRSNEEMAVPSPGDDSDDSTRSPHEFNQKPRKAMQSERESHEQAGCL